jgi:hypothetical protein
MPPYCRTASRLRRSRCRRVRLVPILPEPGAHGTLIVLLKPFPPNLLYARIGRGCCAHGRSKFECAPCCKWRSQLTWWTRPRSRPWAATGCGPPRIVPSVRPRHREFRPRHAPSRVVRLSGLPEGLDGQVPRPSSRWRGSHEYRSGRGKRQVKGHAICKSFRIRLQRRHSHAGCPLCRLQ